MTANKDLRTASKKDIEDSLEKSIKLIPDLTDWVLWTPYTLSKKDQDWYYKLSDKISLHLWALEELDTYLSGEGLILRNTYFGELILTREELEKRHIEAVQPIRERWLKPVHQTLSTEQAIRRMLGEPSSWHEILEVGKDLRTYNDLFEKTIFDSNEMIKQVLHPLAIACNLFSEILLSFHTILAEGDLELIHQNLSQRKTFLDDHIRSIPRWLRKENLPIALEATNALEDMYYAQHLLDDIENDLGIGLVAIIADAGSGKTQMAAQLTASQEERPAGILLHGRNLNKGASLNDLAKSFLINGSPVSSMENLLAALDSAAKRSKCRLPIIIDGLNEAENPKNWREPLASLQETLKRYPNVLMVCTLRTGERKRERHNFAKSNINERESFAVQSLPTEVQKIEYDGFGEDVEEAIEKYFKYFRISTEDAEIPLDLLGHPLTLRIFCEVTNSKRDKEVIVNHFSYSLSVLLEKYIDNICNRIAQMNNLEFSFETQDVQNAIYVLGIELWKGKTREVSEFQFRNIVNDTNRPWNSSIVNLFAQEGVLFRNPGEEPGQYVLTPTYDALGGYLIANSLLLKNKKDYECEWLKNKDFEYSFIGQDNHQLSNDIFKSLVALFPRRFNGKQLWKYVRKNLKKAALAFINEVEAEFIDNATVSALKELMLENEKIRNSMFYHLRKFRFALNHPLNSEFLDSFLNKLTITDRDLCWSEWLRKNKRELFSEISNKEDDITMQTRQTVLQVKWYNWYLTSTDHELRDHATRIIYSIGVKYPEVLFSICLETLQINDPYVKDRLLAACYGVTMARQNDWLDDSFVSVILPKFAIEIYNNMFSFNANCMTTHILTRDYAKRIIQISMLHKPNLFTEVEQERLNFSNIVGEHSEWGLEIDEISPRKESPFHMDFENYTIGGLVPNRRNYDYNNTEYKNIRAQILWRIKQLGWTYELFKDIDSSINNDRYSYRMGMDTRRLDRYAKKYSWIAYYEMFGRLKDQGKLGSVGDRAFYPELDPSFPKQATKIKIIENDFLGESTSDNEDWMNESNPEVLEYVQITDLVQKQGLWIMLDGYMIQADKKKGRKISCVFRSFLVNDVEVDQLYDYLVKSNPELPAKPIIHNTFGGEIPWCETFPENDDTNFTFVSSEKNITQKEFIDFVVKNPVIDYKWDISKSAANVLEHAVTLSKSIASNLNLIGQPQTLDLFSKEGDQATINLSDYSSDYNNTQSFFYIREDYLQSYLKKNNLQLIWVIWGERELTGKDINGEERDDYEQLYKEFKFVNRLN